MKNRERPILIATTLPETFHGVVSLKVTMPGMVPVAGPGWFTQPSS